MSLSLSEDFSDWITKELNDIGVDGDALGSYVVSLIESSSEADPLADASEFLQSSVESDVSALVEKIKEKLNIEKKGAEAISLQTSLNAKQTETSSTLLEDEVKRLDANCASSLEELAPKVVLSKEEKKRQRELVEKYGFQEFTVGADGMMIYDESMDDIKLEKIDNRRSAIDEFIREREEAKAAHEAMKQREKEEKQRNLAKKEKEKRRTQKKEKRQPLME
eukprot:TRINITY_DN12987_c0_g1_i1.p1 TRINITY_DN12987_c0_g1~~TRINITY_DN12987_c0_g1_i1.p1  ORF type:complete len:222 (-),score=108.47 TRINITY_DN12987_c0_g1_i1:9-674(-)